MAHTALVACAVALAAFFLGLTARDWLPQMQERWLATRDSDEHNPLVVAEPRNTSALDIRFSPNVAVEALKQAAQDSALTPAAALNVKEQLAEQLTKTRRFAEAAELRTQLLSERAKMKELGVADFVLAIAAIAQDWMGAMAYERALAALAQVPLGQLDSGSKAVVTRMEADIHACTGDAITALARFEDAKRLSAQAKQPWGISEQLLHVDLLKRVLRSAQRGSPAPPRSVIESLSTAIASQTRALLAAGPWVHPQQLPRTFLPGLASRPWHSLVAGEPGSYPHLRPAADLLESSADDLAAEFKRLKARGLLYPETECINDASGAWRTYSVNAAWVDRNATSDCSFDTPVACALLDSVRAAMARASPPLHILRAGYSALAPGAHLEPHCGMTNGQLKFHVGLIVPMIGKGDERRPCAEIRVGNETRAWRKGAVLFFDDSWEHEVWNRCRAERVVLQLVMAHPDLEATAVSLPGRSAADSERARQELLGQVFGLKASH